jgi:PTH1 family peptidyl-tRNA hydrolase
MASGLDERWLVVGLGNPGPEYAGNRHNVGVMVLEALAARSGGRLASHRSRADVATARLGGTPVVLGRPRSFMNEAGGPVSGLSQYFKVPPERLVVVHDELDLPYGALRLKLGGGDNGHNGLKSVRRALGTGDWYRARVGIGRPPGRMDPAAFVLRDFSAAERRDLALHVATAADAVETLVTDGLDQAQQRFNS